MTDVKIPAAMPQWMKDHMRSYLETEGAAGHLWDSTFAGGPGPLPTLLLTTRGRRSRQPQTLPLLYGTTPTGFVIIGSKGGAPQHPGWFLNLQADPEVTVQVVAEHYTCRARVTAGEERAHLWEQMVAMYPPFADYQGRTEREIPVVALERL
jgi:deazaflavin-dependent oxidoreductase (nitroreductase family)